MFLTGSQIKKKKKKKKKCNENNYPYTPRYIEILSHVTSKFMGRWKPKF